MLRKEQFLHFYVLEHFESNIAIYVKIKIVYKFWLSYLITGACCTEGKYLCKNIYKESLCSIVQFFIVIEIYQKEIVI